MTRRVRVRYAPSPTGQLHIGGARTALFNYLFAKHHDGDFIIRIEDTDVERNIEGGEASQIDNLRWLGIVADESPENPGKYGKYRQMERLTLYKEHTEKLLASGAVYKCFCTPEELEADREKQTAEGIAAPQYNGRCRYLTKEQVATLEAEGKSYAIRFRVPENTTYTFKDMVRGEVSFESSDIGDWVVVKTSGIPTYNYAVAIDDNQMEISHVLRGEEHISNTPKQMMIFDAFGFKAPEYGHLTLIVNEERKKLSKRDESIIQFISQYRDLGYLPEAMFNFFTLLGWSPEGEQEIFTKEEIINIFDVNRLSKSPSMFDTNKLTWMNNRYMKEQPLERVVELCVPHLVAAGKISESQGKDQWTIDLIGLFHEQLCYGAEIVSLTELFFRTDLDLNEEAKSVLAEEQVPAVLTAFLAEIEKLDTLDVASVKEATKAAGKASGQKGKKLFMPIRVATTGQTHGPELPNAIRLLGKEIVVARLKAALA